MCGQRARKSTPFTIIVRCPKCEKTNSGVAIALASRRAERIGLVNRARRAITPHCDAPLAASPSPALPNDSRIGGHARALTYNSALRTGARPVERLAI